MSAVLSAVIGLLVAGLVVRLLVGWLRVERWRPVGDGDLVAVMRAHRPFISARTACATLDLSGTHERLSQGVTGCDGREPFEIGSVTKALTGLLLADSVRRHEVTLDAPVSRYLPELSGSSAGAATLEALARHRAGLPSAPMGPWSIVRLMGNTYLGIDPYRGLDERAVLRIAARVRLRGAGTERYSNLGASLVGLAVARAAAVAYPQLVEQRITGPLGMTSTSAEPNARRRAGRDRRGAWAQQWRLNGYGPAGAVTSTLDDLVVLLRALLTDAAPGRSALTEGLFWQVHTTPEGLRRVWHNGETGGYSAYLAIYPEARRAVVVVSASADAARQERLAAACIRASRQG